MKNSIGIESSVLVRDAHAAFRAAAGAFGRASPPVAVASALAMKIFWFGQMIPQTLVNITSASRIPVEMLMPAADLK